MAAATCDHWAAPRLPVPPLTFMILFLVGKSSKKRSEFHDLVCPRVYICMPCHIMRKHICTMREGKVARTVGGGVGALCRGKGGSGGGGESSP